jgi:hypothetical protein
VVSSGSSAAQSVLLSAAKAAERVDSTTISPNFIKGVLGTTSFASLAFGIRSAWKHSRQPEAADLARAQLVSGVGFATRAFTVATIITVSGFSLAVVGISWLLNVNTPRQFGTAMKSAFGDALRLPQSKNSQSFEDLIRSIEVEKKPVETAEQQSQQ